MSLIEPFLAAVRHQHSTGIAKEHAYRPALHDLLAALADNITPVNDPARSAVGAPDFILLKDEIEIGGLEAKDIDIDIRKLKGPNKNQFERYKNGIDNLVYTNCLDWDFYVEGELVASVTIADPLMGIRPKPEAFDTLENLLREFITRQPQTITSPDDLARRMAGKANLIKDVFANTLKKDEGTGSELVQQFHAFRENLIHDISAEDFADIYAETIAYGMFAARLHDPTVETFTRQEAWELIPKSNPFLRDLFLFIAGPNLDSRLRWPVESLARVFLAADLQGRIMKDFGSLTGRADPFLHFYETFLAAYNPAKRKARGVWYTPEAVVGFIVRAVDDVLKTEFNIPDGLADHAKIDIDWDTGQTDNKGKPITIKKPVHRVQILDPATGTGTFLAEVIKHIEPRIRGIAPAMWSQYVEDDLIPRLHGFELLMASYAMCHMKLDMILTELGYTPTGRPTPDGAQRRLSVYLTNSLEEGEPANQTLPFTQWLSREAKGANTIKRDMPIMCVIGNPPYSGHSSNKSEWIERLMEDYKRSPELRRPAQAKWLSDDYVKFIRMSSNLIEKNGEGVLGFITNHGYLDNPTFVDMREHLQKVFDKIYILDLHGNAKKKETAPDGSKDVNVFDIMQGVAIFIGVKVKTARQRDSETARQRDSETARVFHLDVWGKRQEKNNLLENLRLAQSAFAEVETKGAPWPLQPLNWELREKFLTLPTIGQWFSPNGTPAPGIVTTHDEFAISESAEESAEKIALLLESEDETHAKTHFRLCGTKQWNYTNAKANLSDPSNWRGHISPICYRPFDTRSTVYNPHVAVHRRDRVMGHYIRGNNMGIIVGRQGQAVGRMQWNLAFCTTEISDFNLFYRGGGVSFPLYLYPAEDDLDQTRRINFDPKLYAKLQKLAKHPAHGTPDEVQVFDYIYGVLHCPAYRETYAEFLKIDFPRIPWPSSPEAFWDISAKGALLRKLHLMEPDAVGAAPFPFMGEGDSVVDKPTFKDGKVWINKNQYFDNAPEVSWGFFIGGYQPARKWLKDRKGRELSFDDIRHYQSILKILSETDRVMKTIKMEL